ncbi:HNRNPM family protein [Megaselia abdita]
MEETNVDGNNQGNDGAQENNNRRGGGGGRRGNTRFSDANKEDQSDRERSREREARTNCRVYISNIPYDFRWQDLKDLFRRIVGSVEYVELFNDESGKPRGCGIVEFKDPDNVEKALEKMNRYEINGRELVVKEDHGEHRDNCGRIIREGGAGGGGGAGGRGGGGNNIQRNDDRGMDRFNSRRDDDRISSRSGNVGMLDNFGGSGGNMSYNTYGLSSGFLESLGINGPLHNKIFVANLDYKVDSKKLKQVFKLAGKVQNVELSLDKDGNSRGFAVVEYDHPVEAVQAISMLDRQMLYERRMTVRLDRIPDHGEGLKLPEGLGGIGVGLGPGGEPLKDVAHNLPNQNQNQSSSNSSFQQQQQQQQQNQMNLVAPVVNSVVPSVVPNNANLLGSAGAASALDLNNLNTLRNVVGGLKNLATVGIANPLLTNNLSSLGINLTAQSNDQPLTNNYSTGNNYSSGFVNDFNNQSSGPNIFDSLRNQFGGGNDNVNDFNSQGGSGYGGNNSSGRKSDTIIIKNVGILSLMS